MLSKKLTFDQYLEELQLEEEENLKPEDIYNFYYLNYLLTDPNERSNLSSDVVNSSRFEINLLKKKYLDSFLPIVRAQLQKYLERGRVDSQSFKEKDLQTANYENLDQMMRMTYRSDMKRRNTNWENLTTNLSGLQHTSELKQVMFFIDRINNTIHNTQEAMLVKFPNGQELIQALGDAHRLRPEQLKAKTSGLSFLSEAEETGKAYVFDFDDTLVKTKATIRVLEGGKVVKEMKPYEYNSYKKTGDEIFDFSDFDHINQPVKYKMWKTLENIDRKIGQGKSSSTIYILTARAPVIVDEMEKFFLDNGIKNIGRGNIYAIGGTNKGMTIAEAKKKILEEIKTRHNGQVTFFDDDPKNIALAKGLAKTRLVTESILDEPKGELDPNVWEAQDNPITYVLKAEIFATIADGIDKLLDEDTPIKSIYVIGSLTGYRYTEDSDLDVTMVLDVTDEELEAFKAKLKDINGELAPGTQHPINFFLMNKDIPLHRFDSAYDPMKKEWLKPPKTEGINLFDIYDDFRSFVKKIDIEKEEAKRSLIDIKILNKALSGAADPAMIASKLTRRIEDLDDSVGELTKTFKKVHKDRDKAFHDYETSGGGTTSPNLQPENVKYKLLERYHYLDFLKKLYEAVKHSGGIETPEGFDKVAALLAKNEDTITTRYTGERMREEVDTIDGEKALMMAINPADASKNKAFVYDKFGTDEFLMGSALTGHTALVTSLAKKTGKKISEDNTLRGYWFPTKSKLVLYPYLKGSQLSSPNDEDVEAITHKLSIMPSLVLKVEEKQEESVICERDLKDEKQKIIKDFVKFVTKELSIKSTPKIILQKERGQLKTTAVYQHEPKSHEVRVNTKNRALVDVLRSIAHELVHHSQGENGRLETKHPNIGGVIEDEANAKAGVFVKKFAKESGNDIYADEVNILESIEFHIAKKLGDLNVLG